MKKLLIFCLMLTMNYQQAAAIKNPFSGITGRIGDVTKGASGLLKTLSAEPNIANQMKEAISKTIALRAFLACKGKPAGTAIKSGDKVILKCGSLKVPIDVIRLYFQIIRDKFIGTSDKPGILFAATDLIRAFGIKKSELDKLPELLNGLNSSLKSLDQVLSTLPKTLKVKTSKK